MHKYNYCRFNSHNVQLLLKGPEQKQGKPDFVKFSGNKKIVKKIKSEFKNRKPNF